MAKQRSQNSGRTFQQAVQRYVQEVQSIYEHGNYSEKSFRTPLENLLNAIKPNPDFEIRQEYGDTSLQIGIPDYTVYYKGKVVGFIETKNIGTDLDSVMQSDQIKKYREAVDNLLLTDYRRFILISSDVLDCSLFSKVELVTKGKITLHQSTLKDFEDIVDLFFGYQGKAINTPQKLAEEMARKARLIRDFALEELESKSICPALQDFTMDIRVLLPDVDDYEKADAYAQTMTYGLFLAKIHASRTISSNAPLDLNTAFSLIPGNVGIIKTVFRNASTGNLSNKLHWATEQLLNVLNSVDMNAILSQMNSLAEKDPILYLYEDFIGYFDQKQKENLGIFYTPIEVTRFITKSTNILLKKHFGKEFGLADDEVKILDPATGTGTFLLSAFDSVLNELVNHQLAAIVETTIRNHLLQHFYGFEILITPYVISHLKLTDYLEHKWHYSISPNERIQVYLTNTLSGNSSQLQLVSTDLAEENAKANDIKESKHILAVIGNPPYRAISANNSEWIIEKLTKGYVRDDGSKHNGYKKVDGHDLGEKTTQWLKDDYVKFLLFAQYMIDQNPEGGIVGYITNHSYLDNPTFRGMRQSLMESFNRIYIVNLHGNARKKEQAPDGSKDENIFNIQQGTTIGIFVKNKNLGKTEVLYTDVWGTREEKLEWLNTHTIEEVEWQRLDPISDQYYFVPIDTTGFNKYKDYLSIRDIFPVSSTGIISARDNLVIDFDADLLADRIKAFRDSPLSDDEICTLFNINKKKGWDITQARNILRTFSDQDIIDKIKPISYRPFDKRKIFYDKTLVWDMGKKTMEHMAIGNLAIVVPRQVKAKGKWEHCFVADGLVDSCLVSNGTAGTGYVFPLYLETALGKQSNFTPEFEKFIKQKYNSVVTLEDVFYYIYAILYCPSYRQCYSEFLKRDFPRIPFIDNPTDVKALADIGRELVSLHLMENSLALSQSASPVAFNIPGSNQIQSVKYDSGKIWINETQYFDNVPQQTWDFNIGNYMVLKKWLEYRKGRQLTATEVKTFVTIVASIEKTIELMEKIDVMISNQI